MKTEEEIIQAIVNRDRNLSYEDLKKVYGDSYTLEEYYEVYSNKHPLSRYIEQLIEDIETLTEAGPPYQEIEEDEFDDFSEEDEEDSLLPEFDESLYKEDHSLTTFEALFGLERIALPPPARLNNSFVADLSFAFELLLDSYDITVVFPQGFSSEKLYVWLWAVWDSRKIRYSSFGITLKACTGFCGTCPLHPEYCNCQSYPTDDDNDIYTYLL